MLNLLLIDVSVTLAKCNCIIALIFFRVHSSLYHLDPIRPAPVPAAGAAGSPRVGEPPCGGDTGDGAAPPGCELVAGEVVEKEEGQAGMDAEGVLPLFGNSQKAIEYSWMPVVGAGLASGFHDHELDEGKKMHVHQNFLQKYHSPVL